MSVDQARHLPAGVSKTAETALREAMQRLLTGQPLRTDGRLTKQNLWKEAGVSRATMNRAITVLAEWDAHLAEHGKATPGEARRNEELSHLKRRLADKTAECTNLERQLKAAATAIAALHHDNEALRAERSEHDRTAVVDLNSRRKRLHI